MEEATHEKQENTTDIYPVENKGIEGLAIIDPVIPIDGLPEKKGVVVIFHGAPKTGLQKINNWFFFNKTDNINSNKKIREFNH